MKAVLVCCVVAVFATFVAAQWKLPSFPSVGSVTGNLVLAKQVYDGVTQIHSHLSRIPGLASILPPPTTMAADVLRAFNAASSFQKGLDEANKTVQKIIQDAAKQANLPAQNFQQISQQVNQMFQNMGAQAGQAGSAAGNFLGSSAPQ